MVLRGRHARRQAVPNSQFGSDATNIVGAGPVPARRPKGDNERRNGLTLPRNTYAVRAVGGHRARPYDG